ncbi:MAG: glycosyltransferase family 2 protein [Methanobacterium sp.]
MTYEETVCAVVVTYNRKKLLIECLEAIKYQSRPVNAIYIIDNASTDGTPEVLLDYNYIDHVPSINHKGIYEKNYFKNQIQIHYLRMIENTGGAGGFHEGVKKAYIKGYDWIWIMDDDVEPEKNCLKKLLKNRLKSMVLVPLRLSMDTNSIDEHSAIEFNLRNPFLKDPKCVTIFNKYTTIDSIPDVVNLQDFSFEGPLINSEIIKNIGYPRKDFFIYGDDADYSLRISLKLKENIILIKDAIMYRKLKINDNIPNWKWYYIMRNMNFISLHYGSNILIKTKPIFKSFIAICYNLIKLNPEKSRIWFYSLIDSWKKELPLRYKP